MRVGILATPRPDAAQRCCPALGGALVIVLALPVFLDRRLAAPGWAIAAVLWVGVQAFGLLLGRAASRRRITSPRPACWPSG